MHPHNKSASSQAPMRTRCRLAFSVVSSVRLVGNTFTQKQQFKQKLGRLAKLRCTGPPSCYMPNRRIMWHPEQLVGRTFSSALQVP